MSKTLARHPVKSGMRRKQNEKKAECEENGMRRKWNEKKAE